MDIETYTEILNAFTHERKRAFIEAKESDTYQDSYGVYARGYMDGVDNCAQRIIKILAK